MKDGIPREKVERLIAIYTEQAARERESADGLVFSHMWVAASTQAKTLKSVVETLQKLLDGEL